MKTLPPDELRATAGSAHFSPQEARQVAAAAQQRNRRACEGSEETCDYSKLTPSEAKALAETERKRNYSACLKGYGYCDASRLTPAEAKSIASEHDANK